MLLAVGGSLTSASPASAAELTSVTLGGGSGLQASMQTFSLGAAGCNSYSGTINLADWQLTLSSGSQTLTSVTLAGYMVVGLSAPLTSGQTVTVTYTKNVSRVISCTHNSDTMGSFSYMGVVSGGVQSGGTVVSNPATPTYSNGVLTSTAAVWQNASVNKRSYWLVCTSSHDAMNGDLMSNVTRPADCGPISATALSGQAPTWLNTNPYTVPASVNKWVSCSVNNCTTTALSTTGLFYTWYEFDSGVWTQSATIGSDGSSSGSSSSVAAAPVLTAEQARNTLKPVPAAVQPLVPAFIALNKPMASLGGKVALSAGDFTGLVSAKIAGKSLDFILGNTGKITMTVPQGEAGKTADLVLTFNTGSIILQDAIKYVAPLDVAKVGERPISIAAGSKKITAEVADQIRQAALANVKNDTIQCVAYSASNSAAAKAAAQLTAVQACGVAVKANSDLKVADVVVIVDKLKARTQGVGIKVYKADN